MRLARAESVYCIAFLLLATKARALESRWQALSGQLWSLVLDFSWCEHAKKHVRVYLGVTALHDACLQWSWYSLLRFNMINSIVAFILIFSSAKKPSEDCHCRFWWQQERLVSRDTEMLPCKQLLTRKAGVSSRSFSSSIHALWSWFSFHVQPWETSKTFI